MERKAKETVETVDAGQVEVYSLRMGDLDALSGEISGIFMGLKLQEGGGLGAIADISSLSLKSLRKVIVQCSNLSDEQIESLDVSDFIKVFDVWLRVSKWEEIAPLFFDLVRKIRSLVPKKAIENLKRDL